MASVDEAENEKARAVESDSEDELSARKAWTGQGRLIEGKWFCDCDGRVRAKCISAGSRALPANRGRRYWSCGSNDERIVCKFFLWVDDEAKAKAWQDIHFPQTPKRKTNPFILAREASSKRKSTGKSVTFSNDPDTAIPIGDGFQADEDLEEAQSPSRKSIKVLGVSTPGQEAAANSLPSPESERQPRFTNGETVSDINGTAPLPVLAPAIALCERNEPQLDLATVIVKLLRDENVVMREPVELLLRHEIGLATDRKEAEIQRYKRTIAELSKRLGELGEFAMEDDVFS